MAAKATNAELDRLIKDSKTLTADLMTLRHEVTTKVYSPVRSWRENTALSRLRLAVDEAGDLRDKLWDMYEEASGFKEPSPEFPCPAPRPLTDSKLRLTGGR